jgi:hypothetical protein
MVPVYRISRLLLSAFAYTARSTPVSFYIQALRESARHGGFDGTTARGIVESQHARGLTIQLSQGQGRQPFRPEGAPPAAGVLRSHAALAFDGGEEAAG